MRRILDYIAGFVIMMTYIVFCALLWITVEFEYTICKVFRYLKWRITKLIKKIYLGIIYSQFYL